MAPPCTPSSAPKQTARVSNARHRTLLARISVIGFAIALLPAMSHAHTAGSCELDRPEDRCEAWADVYDDESIRPPSRSDQFVTAAGANHDTVFVALKNVALDPNDPYGATGSWMVLAYDAETGQRAWTAERQSRRYDMPLDLVVSPDGTRVYVTGAAYDAFSVVATDSRVVTVAYDARTGAELWSEQWDNLPDGTDNGKVIDVSADGREVYVGAITTTPYGDLDYQVLAYDTRHGRQKWSTSYSGPTEHGSDVLNAIAADPHGRYVYVTGSSATPHDFNLDYTTLALTTSHGNPGGLDWVARYDGVGEHRPDRASDLAVSPDGSTIVVTGNGYVPNPDGSTGYDAVTVGYTRDGTQLWDTNYAGPGPGVAFDAGRAVVTTNDRAVITTQSAGAAQDDGLDAATVAYDLATGAQQWVHREDQPRSSELAMALAASPDEATAYMISSARPVVNYTALDELVVHAYRIADGTEMWTSRLGAGAGNASEADAIAVTPAGDLAVAGMITRSQSPLGPQSQNRYDALTAVFGPNGQ